MKPYQLYKGGPWVDLDSIQVIHEYQHDVDIWDGGIFISTMYKAGSTTLNLRHAFDTTTYCHNVPPFNLKDYNYNFVLENIYNPFLEAWRNKDE